jgi:hypothetical protein
MKIVNFKKIFTLSLGALLTIGGMSTVAAQAPQLQVRTDAANNARALIGQIAGLNIRQVFQKQNNNNAYTFTLAQNVDPIWNSVKAISQTSPYLGNLLQQVLLAKLVAYFIEDYIDGFFNKAQLNYANANTIAQEIVQHIATCLGSITGWTFANNNGTMTLQQGNFITFHFTLQNIGLDGLITQTVAPTLLNAQGFINDITQAMARNQRHLVLFFTSVQVHYTIGNQQRQGTIRDYINDVTNLLDQQVRQTLAALIQQAEQLIGDWQHAQRPNERDFNIGQSAKGRVLHTLDQGIGNGLNDVINF